MADVYATTAHASELIVSHLDCMDVLEDCTDCNNVLSDFRSERKGQAVASSRQYCVQSSSERDCYSNENDNPIDVEQCATSDLSSRDSDVSSTSIYQEDSSDDTSAMDRDLVCTEPLSTADSAPSHSKQCSSGFVPNTASLPDLMMSIRAAKDREAEEPADPAYLSRHGPAHSPQHYITSCMRNITAGWMVEVAMHFKLQPDTLFLSIDLLDRYMSKSQGYPRNMLQLLAVTCIMVASKQEEVTPPTVEVLTEIAAHCFQPYDLVRLEHHLLESLDWRVQPPTVYTFMCLISQALQVLPWEVFNLASYFAELAVMDHATLCYPASMIAAASLLLSCAASGLHHLIAPLLQLSGYTQEQLSSVYTHLLNLHNCVFSKAASDAEQQAIQPFITVNEKHADLGVNVIIKRKVAMC